MEESIILLKLGLTQFQLTIETQLPKEYVSIKSQHIYLTLYLIKININCLKLCLSQL